MDLKEEAILGSSSASHWYYVSKGRALRSFLGDFKSPEVLDVVDVLQDVHHEDESRG